MTRHRLPYAAACIVALTSSPAFATGVGAGTLIDNTAQATYDSGADTVTVQSNTVTLRVDELLDVAVSSLAGGTTTLAGDAPTAVPFRITNTGNGAEAFALTLTTSNGGNGFDAVAQGIAIDSNANGVYDQGVDAVLGAGAATDPLAADSALTVFALVSLPSGTGDGATSQIQLSATAATGSGAAGTVFSGGGTGGGDAVVGASTATASALTPLVASSFAVTLAKSAAIADPFGGTQPVPGAVVTYSIVANVAGSGSAANLHITDAVPAGTTYRAATLALEGAALSDAADTDAGAASQAGIDVALGSVPAGDTRTVTFQVTIN